MLKNFPSVFGLRAAEGPQYYVISKEGPYQIRKYRPFVIAQTIVRASYEDAKRIGEARLKRYSNGLNESNEIIQSTVPLFEAKGEKLFASQLTRRESNQDIWMLAITLPKNFSLTVSPIPNDHQVRILKIPSIIVATYRFTGKCDENCVSDKAKQLESWVEQNTSYTITSEPRAAFYDPSFAIPLLMRNEIHFTLSDRVINH